MGYRQKAFGRSVARAVRVFEGKFRHRTRPYRVDPLVLALMADFTRSKRELLAEGALLGQQLIVARRQFKWPKLTPHDCLRLLLLACLDNHGWNTVLRITSDTVLCRHPTAFLLPWRRKAKVASNTPRLSWDAVALITRLSQENTHWGANATRPRPSERTASCRPTAV